MMQRTVLAAVCILFSVLQCQGYRKYLSTNLDICESLNVGHGSVEQVSHERVKVVLTDSMKRESTCFNPRKTYNVSIIVEPNDDPIYGLLIVKDGNGGFFPAGSLGRRDLRNGPCPNGVSHKCNHYIVGDDADYLAKCSLGHTIDIPFIAPENGKDNVRFRYSIVFKEHEFLENRTTVFSPCPGDEPEIPNGDCDASEFQNLTTARRASRPRVCPGNPREDSDELRYHVRDGTNYTCRVQNFPIRKRVCATGCENNNGQKICCKPDTRPRNFDCIPNNNSNADPIVETWEVATTKKCLCYLCEDVCPPIPIPRDNSVDVEHTAAATTATTATTAAATTTTSAKETTTSPVTTETSQPSSTELDVKDASIA